MNELERKQFEEAFKVACRKHSPHEVWRDWIVMTALAISMIDPRPIPSRSEEYVMLLKRYDEAELAALGTMFSAMVSIMENEPMCDLLGDLYMRSGLGESAKGQFFTPYDLSELTARLSVDSIDPEEEMRKNHCVLINDPACGAGAMLLGAMTALAKRNFDYQRKAFFVGQDLDRSTALMCYIQLSLRGVAGLVVVNDTLRKPFDRDPLVLHEGENLWYTPMFFSEDWALRRMICATCGGMNRGT